VTKNLYDALADVRKLELGVKGHFIWVDAISINQSDLQERNDQVRLMGEIYSRVAIVLAYLGPERRFTQASFSAILDYHALYPNGHCVVDRTCRHREW